MPRDDLLTAGQVAEQGKVHRTTVHHWAKDGKLRTAQVVNGIRLFARKDVDAFLAARPAPDAPEVEAS